MPLNTRFKAAEAGWILDRSRVALTFCSPPFLGNDYPAMLAGRDGVVVLDESLWESGRVAGGGWPRSIGGSPRSHPTTPAT